MYKILTLNNIAVEGLRRLPRERYEVASEIAHPDAILLRSANMHEMEIPATVAAIGRAGAGTNNIPCDKLPHAVCRYSMHRVRMPMRSRSWSSAGMLMGARNLAQASEYVKTLKETGDELKKAVEAGKKQFVGFELPGKTLGVIGLGAIGVEVANAALALGMKVDRF